MSQTKKGWILLAIYLATFMTAVESTIVITAANAIANSFGREIPIALLFSSYLFSSALSTPVFSRLADQYGKKPIFIIGLLLFMAGTFLCGISQSFFILVFFRLVQGIGAGGIMPITFSLIGDLFDYESRGRIMGLNNSAWGIASLAAPLLGGLLVENFSWHWVFFINIPVGLITILILLLFYDEEKRPSVSFSYQELGQYLFLVTSLFLLLVGIQIIPDHFILGGGVFLFGILVSFILLSYENKVKEPVLPVETLRSSDFLLFNLVTFLINGAMMGFQVYLPLWIQTQLSLSPSLGGLALLPSSVFFITGSMIAVPLGKHFGTKRLLTFCMGVNGLVFLILGFLPQMTPYFVLLILASFSGFGTGTTVTTSVLSAQVLATDKNISTVSGFITLCRNLGQSFMITFFGIVFQLFGKSTFSIDGYQGVFFSALFVVLLSILMVLLKRDSLE